MREREREREIYKEDKFINILSFRHLKHGCKINIKDSNSSIIIVNMRNAKK
jgi:hypothetical protein